MTEQESKPLKYWTFISYSSKDRAWRRWLQKRLENFAIPKDMQGIKLADGVRLGKRLRPIFRDRDELAGSSELGGAIKKALTQSRYLVVLCSRNSAKSQWVNKEIEDFRKIAGDEKILALILEGVPNASSNRNVDDAGKRNLNPHQEHFFLASHCGLRKKKRRRIRIAPWDNVSCYNAC